MGLFEDMQKYYENEGREDARLTPGSVQYLEYLTAKKYISAYLPQNANVLDNCAGAGAYAFWLAQEGHCVTAGDVVPYNVQLMQEKQKSENGKLREIYCGDARELTRFESESFDAVLCMGALYHLPKENERNAAVSESLRVLKKGGIFFASCMNRYAVIMNNLEPELANIEDMLRFRHSGREGIFYATTIAEAEALFAAHNLQKKCHAALDGMTYFMFHTAQILKPEAFENWAKWHFASCEDESVLHQSYHTLYVGEKI